jgi:type IV pilus assembly protein PilV
VTRLTKNCKSPTSGFAMLEVLIAIVILGFGLLGFAGLQATGIRANHGSYLRSQAALQAYDMADRMRSNLKGVTAGSYDSISGSGSDPACITSGCTSAQMAQYDQYAWNSANAALLPSGRGTVSRSGSIFVITTMWDADKTGATGTGCTTASTDLKCFQIRVQP